MKFERFAVVIRDDFIVDKDYGKYINEFNIITAKLPYICQAGKLRRVGVGKYFYARE